MQSIRINELPQEMESHMGTVRGIQFPRQGHTSDVGIVTAENGTYVVKRTKGARFCAWLAQEAAVLKALSSTGLPVPKLYQFLQYEGQAWTLTEFLEGETIRNALFHETRSEKRNDILYQFGKILSAIHTTPCPVPLQSGSYWLDDMLAQAAFNLENYEVDGTAMLLEELRLRKPQPIQQTLIHGDFTIDNVLVRDGRITGIIDWSGGAYGDPRYDVSLAIRPKPRAFEAEEDKQVFFAGYGDTPVTESEYLYFEDGLYQFF